MVLWGGGGGGGGGGVRPNNFPVPNWNHFPIVLRVSYKNSIVYANTAIVTKHLVYLVDINNRKT